MGKSLAFLAVIALFTAAYADDDNPELCEQSSQRECGRRLNLIFQETPFITDEVLTNNCSDIEENLQCIEDYLRSCDREQLDYFLLVMTSPRILLAEFCVTDSPLRTAYREQVSCLRTVNFRNIPEQLVPCFESLDESTKDEIKAKSEQSEASGDLTEFMCAIYQPMKECLKELATGFCSEEAGDLVEEVIERGSKTPREKLCPAPTFLEIENLAENVFTVKRKKK
uniref:U70-Liphistoxin-Lth1a_1 n=1 Tax=Liphistius thaleban TaxID=1905330 RepID=A0A4Q8K3Z9_9ARAC